MRGLFLFLLSSIGAIVVVVLAFIAWNTIAARNDEANLREVHRSFSGLSRDKAYARLRQMWLTPVAWYDPSYYGIVSTPLPQTPWPPNGDAEVDFSHAHRVPPDGACGANERIILHFKHDRVSNIVEYTTDMACL